jgi:hypothetical protein
MATGLFLNAAYRYYSYWMEEMKEDVNGTSGDPEIHGGGWKSGSGGLESPSGVRAEPRRGSGGGAPRNQKKLKLCLQFLHFFSIHFSKFSRSYVDITPDKILNLQMQTSSIAFCSPWKCTPVRVLKLYQQATIGETMLICYGVCLRLQFTTRKGVRLFQIDIILELIRVASSGVARGWGRCGPSRAAFNQRQNSGRRKKCNLIWAF